MKRVQALFPLLLTAACCVVWFWQNAVASLPYLPNNCIVPLGVMTPALLALTFFATFVLEKQSGSSHPALRAFGSTGAMLLPIAATVVFFLSFVSYRYSGVLPVLVLPNWPTGIVTLMITALCVLHLTGLLIAGCVKRKYGAKQVFAAAGGWIVLNVCLFLVTV